MCDCYCKICPKKSPGADHWTFDFEGGKDGGGGEGGFWKKKFLQAHVGRENLQAAQKEFFKKILALL